MPNKSFILRYGNAGKRMCPVIADVAGLDVFSATTDDPPRDVPLVFRWGTTANCLSRDQKVLNRISAIETTCNKAKFRETLSAAGLAPRTWRSYGAFTRDGGEFPVLLRPSYHERSDHMHLCNNDAELLEAANKYRDYYISSYIKKVRELRVMVVQGRVVWAIEKRPPDKNAISWGCVQDGEFDYLGWDEWPMAAVEVSIKAFNLSDLDFGAIDVILDKDGNAYVLEINTAPYLTRYYAETIGKAFKWIVEKGRDHFNVNGYNNWRDVIHPAVSGQARV